MSISKLDILSKINKRRNLEEKIDLIRKLYLEGKTKTEITKITGSGNSTIKKYVKEKLHSFMGKVFEEMCRFYTLSQGLDGKLNCLVTNVGSWWGPGHDHIPTDIDVVGIDDANKKAVLGECKFKNEVIDKEVYEALMDRSGLIDKRYEEVEFLLFSLTGFSKWVKENARTDRIRLVTLEELY